MMCPSRRTDELSLADLENLVRRRRRRVSEAIARRLAASQDALGDRNIPNEDTPDNRGILPPSTWRGADGASRFFGSLLFGPLDSTGRGNSHASSDRWSGRRARTKRSSWLLLAIEIVALGGLVATVSLSFQRLADLNAESRRLQQRVVAPTITATTTPIVVKASVTTALLLPGGRPSGEAKSPAVPTGTRVGLQQPTPAPSVAPTLGPQTPVRIVIDAIGVDAPIIAGDSWEDLKLGVGHRQGTADPGGNGNMVLSAHNDTYGEIFRYLNDLEPGDEILVYTTDLVYRYITSRSEIVAPTQIEVMAPTEHASLTLITCYPYLLDTHRVIIKADLATAQ